MDSTTASLPTLPDLQSPRKPLDRSEDLPRPWARYELLEVLGRGGMGTVYGARDRRLGRRVAVKILASERQMSPSARQRFEREARLTSALDHPGIVTLFDVDQFEGRDFIVMERVEGVPLSQRLKTGNLEIPEALAIALAVADAMGAAHDSGIVHRDLKPSNIMVIGPGRIKILDFGIAKLTHDFEEAYAASAMATPLTEVGTPVGTLGYMAPEQIGGETVDARADLFALGVVLYRMLAQRAPFGGCHPAVLAHQILHRDPAPLDLRPTDLSLQLDAVLQRALAKEPGDRWGSMEELSQALLRVVETCKIELPTPTTSSGAFPRPDFGGPRRSGNLPPWALVAAVLALGLALGWLAARGWPGL